MIVCRIRKSQPCCVRPEASREATSVGTTTWVKRQGAQEEKAPDHKQQLAVPDDSKVVRYTCMQLFWNSTTDATNLKTCTEVAQESFRPIALSDVACS